MTGADNAVSMPVDFHVSMKVKIKLWAHEFICLATLLNSATLTQPILNRRFHRNAYPDGKSQNTCWQHPLHFRLGRCVSNLHSHIHTEIPWQHCLPTKAFPSSYGDSYVRGGGLDFFMTSSSA